MTADVLDDGRRRAVDRGQLGTMNNPMHRRPRRRPRKWNNHRRGPGDRYRSSGTHRSSPALGDVADIDAGMCHSLSRRRSRAASINLLRSRHPRPSRSFFLLTSDRRHSASVSEILNVAPFDQRLSTDVRHPFRITNPGIRTPGPRTRGSETPGSKNPGLPAPGIASKSPTSSRTQRLPGVPVACPRSIPEPMLAKFRGARYDDRSRAGRRSPTGGGPRQLGTMNNPMHRRPRRRPRKWNNHRRGPGDRYRSLSNGNRSIVRGGCMPARQGRAETARDAFRTISRDRGIDVPDTEGQIEWVTSMVDRLRTE
jgi:hypothetical protein